MQQTCYGENFKAAESVEYFIPCFVESHLLEAVMTLKELLLKYSWSAVLLHSCSQTKEHVLSLLCESFQPAVPRPWFWVTSTPTNSPLHTGRL